ncbi:unnamed protein product [Miscanthus lutarioriparius]|uniref:Uncharacterized protein n=1 Tax=Miscanthus lutarioriparius TaxID=422564 RepID=A0A811PBJ8_9POAL|nr:unnamed protein product [Miscanthus lutarioriparius]
MLSALLGGYLTAYPPPPLPPATATAPEPERASPSSLPCSPQTRVPPRLPTARGGGGGGVERMEDRIRKKRHKIVQTKTGSPNPMKVVFNKFDFSNSYIWFEFYNALLPKDVTLISDSLRSWHIVGRLGGCNSMNMQLSQLPLDCKRPTYDALEGANVTPTSFYNIGDLEIQDNLA